MQEFDEAASNAADEADANTGSRLDIIASVIRSSVMPVLEADTLRGQARDQVGEASAMASSVRMEVMAHLAAAAHAEEWSEDEIARAAVMAVNQSNDRVAARTLSTFIGECKHAMHSTVRGHVPQLVMLCSEAWEAEKTANARVKPLRKAFRRLYHMTIAAFRLARAGTVLESREDVLEWAERNNPTLRADVIATRVRKVRKLLDTIAVEFPVDGFTRAAEILSEIDLRSIKASRERGTHGAPRTPPVRQLAARSRRLRRDPVLPPHMSQAPQDLNQLVEEVLGPLQ